MKKSVLIHFVLLFFAHNSCSMEKEPSKKLKEFRDWVDDQKNAKVVGKITALVGQDIKAADGIEQFIKLVLDSQDFEKSVKKIEKILPANLKQDILDFALEDSKDTLEGFDLDGINLKRKSRGIFKIISFINKIDDIGLTELKDLIDIAIIIGDTSDEDFKKLHELYYLKKSVVKLLDSDSKSKVVDGLKSLDVLEEGFIEVEDSETQKCLAGIFGCNFF